MAKFDHVYEVINLTFLYKFRGFISNLYIWYYISILNMLARKRDSSHK